jgi:hypothetical protein
MVNIVAGQTTHVVPVMLPSAPIKVCAISGMASETPFVSLASGKLGRVSNVPATASPGAGLGVLVAVLMALFAFRSARVFKKLGALAVTIEGEGVHNCAVALEAVSSDHGFLNRRFDRLRLRRTRSGLEIKLGKTRNDGSHQ